MKMCPAPSCDRPAKAQAHWARNPFCRFHTNRLYETGDVVLQAPRTTWERFIARVRWLANDCWQWTGGGTGRGHEYGQFWFNNNTGLAHRYAYQTMVGPIPVDREIDHLCRNKRCVNPGHLEVVTASVNMRRAFAARKGAQ